MAAYTGLGNFPYWMTIVNTGAQAVPAVISENIPVTVGVNYQFDVVCSYATTYASGMQVFLQWYNANGSLLSQTTLVTQTNMTGGVFYEVNSGTQTAPANASYALAYIQCLGTPAESNPLQVFSAQMTDQDGNIVNVNYAFTYTFWPWTASTGSPTLAWNFSPLLAGDSDSLVIDNQVELMGGIQGVPSALPELLDSNGQGPTFRILAPPSLNSAALGYQQSYDLNAPQPTQDVVASMLLDGERPFGDRASNRTMSFPIVIFGTQAGGMNQVLKAREYLMSIVDQQTYTIKWTSADTGLPMLFDCFRALPSLPVYGMNYSAGGTATGQTIGRPNYPIAMITLEIQALPYGRSDIDGIQNLSFASPIVGGISPQAQAASTLDTFTVVYGNPPILSNPAIVELGFANPTSVSTWNISTGANVAAGNTSIVIVQGASTAGIAVSDTQGNVYSQFASQSTGSGSVATYFIANVANPLVSGVDHVTVSGVPSANYSSVWNSLQGGWVVASTLYSNHQTGSTFSQTFNANEYNFILYLANGLGSAGTAPTGFQSQGNFGNGFNNWFTWYSQPLNQTTVSISGVTSLPNPSAEIVVALAPANRGWQIDTKTVPGTYIGGSAHYTPVTPLRAPYPAATYQATLTSPVSIVGNPVLSMYFGQSYDTQWPKDPKFISNVTFQWTLTDDVGRVLNFSSRQKAVPWGTNPSTPRWRMINTYIPQGKAFNYNSVTAYTLRITNWTASGHTGYIRMHAWINDIVANPQTVQNSPSPRGAVYQMLGLPGSARSPISVQCQLPAAQNITKEITTPATGNWIVPPGVYSVQAEAWAGGGAGAAANLTRTLFGGGGGGGEYAQEPALSVLPGRQIPWSLGAGGTPGQLQNTVVQFTKAGLGHWLCPPNVTNILVEAWGGGAAGGAGAGGGGGGEYAYVNMPVTPGVTYATWTGAGGKSDTGTSSAQVAARNGTTSWFGPTGNLNPVQAYVRASGGFTSLTGSSSGGLGGTSGSSDTPTVLNRTGFCVPSGNQTTATIISEATTPMMVAGDTALVVVQTSAAATISLKDTAGNRYTQIGTCNNTGAFCYVFVCYNAKGMSRRGTVTISGIGGAHVMGLLYDIPGIVSLDVAAVATSGTGTTVSVTSNNGNYAGDAVIAIVSSQPNGLNGAGTNAAGFVYGSASFNPSVSPVLNIGIGYANAPTTAGITANPTFASSTAWSALALTFRAVARQPGGRGGTSPGPSGGGGGGAAGLPGPGGVGGNSLPATSTGRWQAGGTGGTGTGAGGNGGAGAPTPGFPVVGSSPGGGGGGGYQTAPIFNPANPSVLLPGQKQTNFLGADGGVGMVQLTYTVGSGSPVNGGNTTFGSTPLTGTVLTAHGGQSAANNSAQGATGGTGSTNTIHNNGGNGGFNYETTGMARASYLSSPYSSGGFITLNSATWNQAGGILGASAASVNQGVAIAIIASAAKVIDWQVTDSAGNIYQPQGIVTAATGGNTVYAYVADIEYPITTSTTLSVLSATSQQAAVLWYGSTYYISGVTSGNSGSNSGTGSTATAQFGTSDTQTIQIELGVVTVDSSRTVSSVQHGGATWFNASSTNALTWNSTCQLSAFYTQNLGGGTGASGSGDTFQANLSGSGNWATLAIPLAVANQQDSPVLLSQNGGTTPGASTAWNTNGLAIQAQGVIVVAGALGSGASISAAPTAVTDSGGNKYTIQKTQILPSNGGNIWVATAPVTAALPATATGTVNWGGASAAPNYMFSVNWLPNATGVDGTSSVTGNSATVSGSFTPSAANDFVFAHNVVVSAANGWGGWAGQYNWISAPAQSYLRSQQYATQAIDLVCPNFTSGISSTMPWATIMLGLSMSAYGTGGGAAGGSGNAGYPGIWGFGGPGYTGGGKGGQGAAPPPQNGNGASYPGGGGGGCLGVSGTPFEGGQGAPGAIRLTWTPPLQTFNTLIVHSLGANSDPNVNPVTPIPITDAPNNTEYLVPSLNGVMNATFNSTYTVLLSNFVWNSVTSSTPRHITVTINQYEYPGGPKASVQVARAITPATDSVNGLLSMGEVTLPVKDYIKHNDQSYFTVSINDTDSSDRFMDVILLDTLGQTALINIDPGQQGFGQYINYFIDEATSDRDLGFVGASFQERQHQVSVLDYAQISGGALYVGPGDNLFFVYSPAGAPNLALQYAPRWYLDRTV